MWSVSIEYNYDDYKRAECSTNHFASFETYKEALIFGYLKEFRLNHRGSDWSDWSKKWAKYKAAIKLLKKYETMKDLQECEASIEGAREECLGEAEFTMKSGGHRVSIIEIKPPSERFSDALGALNAFIKEKTEKRKYEGYAYATTEHDWKKQNITE